MTNIWQKRWQGPGGFGQVLALAVPLIVSTSAQTIQIFVDRMFLTWHSPDAVAASMQGGITHWAAFSLFVGVVSYANTFVAQYVGANRPERVGPALWQAIYFSLAGGVIMWGLIPLAGPLFNAFGHSPAIRQGETVYFQILCVGDLFYMVETALSCFYTGRGRTTPVMLINILATAVNALLDYILIFGHWGAPAMGIAGAAWGTVASGVVACGVYIILLVRRKYRREYALFHARPERELFGRLLRYGLPNGLHFMLDMSAFALFTGLVGRFGAEALQATSIAFQINMLAFMPMIGFSIAVSTLVGQALGDNNPALAVRSTWSATLMTFTYMTLIGIAYFAVPQVFIWPFAAGARAGELAAIIPTIKVLLIFIAFYCLFDTGNIIFAAALKGAGDTRFVMFASVIFSWSLMVVPTWLSVRRGWGLYVAWTFMSGYVCVLAAIFLARFLQGRWKTMRVIEPSSPGLLPAEPEFPTIEADIPPPPAR